MYPLLRVGLCRGIFQAQIGIPNIRPLEKDTVSEEKTASAADKQAESGLVAHRDGVVESAEPGSGLAKTGRQAQ